MLLERKRKFITNSIFCAIILILFYFFIKYIFLWVLPFLIAFFIAILLQQPLNFVCRHSKVPRKAVAVGLVILTTLLVFGIVGGIGYRLVAEFRNMLDFVGGRIKEIPNMLDQAELRIVDFLRFLPDSMQTNIESNVKEFMDSVRNLNLSNLNIALFQSPLAGLWGAAKQVPYVLVSIIITFISCIFMTIDYRTITAFIRRQFPPKHKSLMSDLKKIIFSTFFKMGRAYLLLMFITFVELSVAFLLMGVQYAISVALLVALVDILPVLGTGTVLLPWALYSLVVGDTTFAVGLIVVYAIITLLRNYLEPRLVAGQLGLNPLVTLCSMYIGMQIFGFWGLFLLPMTVVAVKLLHDAGKVHIWKTEKDEEREKKAALHPE